MLSSTLRLPEKVSGAAFVPMKRGDLCVGFLCVGKWQLEPYSIFRSRKPDIFEALASQAVAFIDRIESEQQLTAFSYAVDILISPKETREVLRDAARKLRAITNAWWISILTFDRDRNFEQPTRFGRGNWPKDHLGVRPEGNTHKVLKTKKKLIIDNFY